jgi:hypothetical protein
VGPVVFLAKKEERGGCPDLVFGKSSLKFVDKDSFGRMYPGRGSSPLRVASGATLVSKGMMG